MRQHGSPGRGVAVAAALALALAGCARDDVAGTERVEPTDTDEVVASAGFGDCDAQPNICNSGEREAGGTITWLVNAQPSAWFSYSPEGGSVYTLQALNGIWPYTGQWAPDGVTYEFNMDLLADEPELLGEDPFTYAFRLRDEAVWDDGTAIDADDFIVSWKLATSEAEGHCIGCRSRSASDYDRIERIEGSDDGKTVTVTLKEGEADAEWFELFSAHSINGGLVPAHVAEQSGFDVDDPQQLGAYFEHLNETMPTFSGGPYRLVEGDLENQVIKEPNENYYGDTHASLDTVVIRFISDEGAWAPALANGEVHGSSPATFGEDVIRSIQELPDVYVHIGDGPTWEHLDFNLDNPWFDDVALRRAIFTAVDVDDIGDRVYGSVYPDFVRRTNPTFVSTSPYHVDLVTPTGLGSGDIDAALEILEQAGYDFDGTTLTRDGETVGPFRLRSTSRADRDTTMALVQSYLAELGIQVTIEPTEALGVMLAGQDYDIALFGWSGSPFFVGTAAQLWRTGSGSNFGQYSNPEFDELADLGERATTQEEAAEYENQAAEILMDDAYVLPLLETPIYVFVTDAYANIRDNGASSLRGLYNDHEWGVLAQ